MLNYIWLSLKAIVAFKPFQATIFTEDEKIQGHYQMITIANTRQFGNNALIAPKAKPDDGIIDLVLVKPIPFYFYPSFVFQLFFGRLKKSKYIDFLRINDPFTIHSEFNKFHIDGEPVEFRGPINISVERQSVRIIKTASYKQ